MSDSATTPTVAMESVASRRRRVRWRHEIAGGLSAAVVVFPITVPLGLLALAPLGPAYAGIAVAAGLASAALGGLAASALGSDPRERNAPLTALALVVNTLLAAFAAEPAFVGTTPDGVPRLIALAFVTLAVASVLQIGLGALRLGQAIKFVPRPVLAGFRNGLALLIAIPQAAPLLGTDAAWVLAPARLMDAVQPWTLVVGLVTIAAIAVARARRFAGFALVGGLLVGTATDLVLRARFGDEALGARIGSLPTLPQLGQAWRALIDVGSLGPVQGFAMPVLAAALTIAILGAVLSLLALRVTEDITQTRVDGNRELMAQGAGNAVAAIFGGVPIGGSTTATVATIKARSCTRWSALVTGVALTAVLAIGQTWIGYLPNAALAGVMMVVAYDMVDGETFRLIGDLAQPEVRAESLVDLGLIAAVTIASLAFNIVAGVAVGVVISAAIFAVKSSRKIVRRRATGATRHSLRQRSDADRALLAAHGEAIVVLELEGPVFFGTAERLADAVEREGSRARFVVLDWRRVNGLDATGAHVVGAIARRLRTTRRTLVLAAVDGRDGRRRTLDRGCPPALAPTFHDADRALEWCEERLLEALPRGAAEDGEIALERADLCRHLEAHEVARLRRVLTREVHPAGAVLFREGDIGPCLYLLTKGAVTMLLRGDPDNGDSTRLATFLPGVVFGELAVLEGRPRSADGVCDADSVVYVLSGEALQSLGVEDPALAIKLYKALALTLAGRLRTTTSELRLLVSE